MACVSRCEEVRSCLAQQSGVPPGSEPPRSTGFDMKHDANNDTIELRPATEQDSAFAYNLKKAVLGPYIAKTFGSWDDDAQRALHGRQFRPAETQIIMRSGEAIGLLAVDRHLDKLRLRQLFVLPEAQNRGIGTRVARGIVHEARAKCLPVVLQVLKTNPRAKSFYERLGFVVTGETGTHHQMAHSP